MKSYNQYCAVARALDIVGDRWTLLIIRELLLQGACRFTDLKNGLPGIATNLLSDRIRELEQHGLIARRDAPPPIGTNVIELTERGVQLKDLINNLALWGVTLMDEREESDAFQPQWFEFPIRKFLSTAKLDSDTLTIGFYSPEGKAYAVLSKNDIHFFTKVARKTDLALSGAPDLIMSVLAKKRSLEQAQRLGLQVDGDGRVLDRVLC